MNASGLVNLSKSLSWDLHKYDLNLDQQAISPMDRRTLYRLKREQYQSVLREQFENLPWAEQVEFYITNSGMLCSGISLDTVMTPQDRSAIRSMGKIMK